MKDFFYLNGFVFTKQTDFFLCKDNIYGWKDFTFNLIYQRFEKPYNAFNNIVSDKETEWNKFKSILSTFFPQKKELKKKYALNIFFLDFLNTYRGLRHSKGLPVRGQRTWTNAWSVYRSNLTLRNYKLDLAKRIYGNLSSNTVSVMYLAEQMNYIWKLQWKKEWRQARNKRLILMYNEYNNLFKIDLNLMSKGFLDGFDKKNMSKKKQYGNKNTFTLGFEPNFVAYYLDPNKANKEKSKFQLVFNEEPIRARLTLKKKTQPQQKKQTNVKKKNLNWD